MKRSWLAVAAVALLGLLAGLAIAGRPTNVDEPVVLRASTTSAPTTLVATTTTDSPTTTAVLDPSAVRIVVANGTNTAGIAATTADLLIAAGFTTTQAVDAIVPVTFSVVFAREGFQAQAVAVAQQLGLDVTTVRTFPSLSVTSDDAAADVIVAIGDDFPT